jgi:hypothetical protein
MNLRTLFTALMCTLIGAGAPLAASAQTKPLPYRLFADVVAARVCVPRTTFNPGDTIVWRAEVQDAAGVRLTADRIKALGLTGTIQLKDGTKVPLAFGIHPPFPNAPATDTYWAGTYYVKTDHPTGTLAWTATVSDSAGNTVSFTPIGQSNGASVLTIAEKGAAASAKP